MKTGYPRNQKFPLIFLQLVSKSLERKQPEFLNVDTERLQEALHDQRKSSSGDLEEVEQLQGVL